MVPLTQCGRKPSAVAVSKEPVAGLRQTEARQFILTRTISLFWFAGRRGEGFRFRRLRLPDRALTGDLDTCGWISILEARPPVIIEASTLVASLGSSTVDDGLAVNELFAVFSCPIGAETSLCACVDPSCRASAAIDSFWFGIGTLPPWDLEGAGNSHFSLSPLNSAERCKPRTHALTCADNLLTIAGPIVRWGRDWRLIAAISDENLRKIAAERWKPWTHALICVDNLPPLARPIRR